MSTVRIFLRALMHRRYRCFNSFQLQLRLLQLRQQLLLLFAIGHQDDAAVHHFYAITCCPVSNPASRSHFPERVRLGVFLFAPCGRYPTINVRSVFAAGKSGVECGLAIINPLIVGEVRRSVCVPAQRSVV